MFDVGSIRAQLEVTGAQAFQQALLVAGDAADQLRAKLVGAGVPLKQVESTAKQAGAALSGEAKSAREASTQAAVLDRSLDSQSKSAKQAANAAKETSENLEKQARSSKTAAAGADGLADAYRASGSTIGDLREQIGGLDEEGKRAFTEVGQAATGFGAVIAGGVGIAVKEFADFDAEMSNVQSALGATKDAMGPLRDQAIQLGADTAFSAKEAAEGQAELAKAGVSTAEILSGGLQGSLALAAAGNISVAEAAETAATAMTQFKLAGTDVPHVADLLANGANAAQGGVHDLGEALKQSGLVASQFGVSVDETVGTLSAFASAGLLGSDAGTSFKQMLLQLASPTDKAAGYLEDYNIHAYDAQGNFVGLANLAGQLQAGFRDVSAEQRNAAFSIIFGSDAIRSANVLYDQGADSINQWTETVGKAGGAAQTAATLQDNLRGDLEKLGGAFSSLFITAGSGADGPLRDLIQSFTNMVDSVNQLPAPVLQTGLVLGGAVAIVALFGGAMLIAVPKVLELRAAIQTLNASTPALRTGLGRITSFLGGPWGAAMAAGAAVMLVLQESIDAGAPSLDKLSNKILTTTNSMKQLQLAGNQTKFQKFVWGDAAAQLEDLGGLIDKLSKDGGDSWFNLTGAQEQARQALERYGDSLASIAGSDLPAAQTAFKNLADQNKLSADEQEKLLNGPMSGYADALAKQASALGLTADKTTMLALATGEYTPEIVEAIANTDAGSAAMSAMGDQAQGAARSIDDIVKSLKDLQDVNVSAIEAESAFQAAIDDAHDAVKDNTEGLNAQTDALNATKDSFDLGTEAGRNATAGMLDIADAAKQSAAALFEQTGSQDTATGALQKGRDALAQALGQYGITGDAAQAYIDTVLGTPENWATQFVAQTGDATGNVNRFREVITRIPGSKNFRVVAATGDAQLTIDNFIRQNDGRVVRIRTVNERQEVVVGSGPTQQRATQADGGLWMGGRQTFADGGFSIDFPHVAHFAAGGTWRTFAEPETMGEAYIPLSPMKRERSTEILDQTAGMFGYDLVKPGGIADGGTVGSSLTGLQLSGTLDLGDGLTGRIDARVVNVLSDVATVGRKGTR